MKHYAVAERNNIPLAERSRHGKDQKTDSLLFKFALIFIIFAIVTLTFSGFATYRNQDKLYREQSPAKLLKLVKNEADAFTGQNDPFDDVTMMSAAWRGNVQ